MKFLTIWYVRPGEQEKATERFLRTGAQPPEGIETLGRWHFLDGTGGIHLYECNDLSLVREYSYTWGDVLELSTKPVLEDADVAAAVTRALKR